MQYQPTYRMSLHPRRREGCLGRALFIALIVFAFTLASCGLCLFFYVIFPPPPVNILVMGLDARPGEGYVTRTDSIMVVGVKPSGFRTSVLSIPRDLFISVPEYGSQRINTVNMLGEMEEPGTGPELLQESIALSFGMRMDAYVRLDFNAFEDLVDAVGGVTIDVEREVIDHSYPTGDNGTMTVHFEVGRQHMDGERALQYARTRHSDDDYFRAARQQQVLSAFTRKLMNPFYWPGVVDVLVRHVDTDLSPFDLITTAPALLLNTGHFDRLVINREYITPVEGGAAPNYELLAPWIEERFR